MHSRAIAAILFDSATLEGVYRTGGAWSFRTSEHTSPERDDWYAANCRCVAAAMRAFSGEPKDDRLVDGAAALRIEAPLWAGTVATPPP